MPYLVINDDLSPQKLIHNRPDLTREHEGQAATLVEHHCTVSIGVTVFVNQEASHDDLLKWADMAMYEAKQAGRDTVCFHGSSAG